ncbi:MAG: phosphopantetheine-binding protein [bacterium]|nr:phosphopantetheine-binding protein [bacterium]
MMENGRNETEKDAVIAIIAEVLNIDPSAALLDAKIEDLAEDSVQLFSLMLALEKHYATEVDYDDLVEIETVGDIVAYIDKKVVAH